MDYKTLMPNNIILYGIINEPISIKKIDPKSVVIEMATGCPLTNEWFDKFKFQKLAENYVSERFKFMFKKGYNYWYVVDRLSLTYLTKIEFVHELQQFMLIMDGKTLKL